MKNAREKMIESICPSIPNTSGIYAFYRIDEAGIRRSYVGQALRLRERCASHAINERMFSLGLIDEKTRDKIKAEISIRK